MLRGHVFLVRQRTVLKTRVHAYLTGESLRCPQADLYGKGGRAWLATVPPPRVVRYYVDLLLIDHLSTQIAAVDRDLRRHCRKDAAALRLQTIPGVGPFGALLLQAEIGSITPFARAQELAAYEGLTPSTRSSGGKTRHGGVGRGNPWLKWILIEILQTLERAPGPVGDHLRISAKSITCFAPKRSAVSDQGDHGFRSMAITRCAGGYGISQWVMGR